jgi:type I restriction enzyme S subunit
MNLIPNKGYNNEFLYYLMLTLKPLLIQNASGSTFLEISPKKLKKLEILTPDFPEQTRIATILSEMDAEIEALERRVAKVRLLKQGMMQSLLAGKVRLV